MSIEQKFKSRSSKIKKIDVEKTPKEGKISK